MRIIDSHMHLGDCRVFGCNIDEKWLMETLEKYNVSAAIVQPYPGASDEADVHKRIYELSKKYPGCIYGLASVNPHTMVKAAYQDKIKKYVEEYGFVGVKVHTIGHALHPLSEDARTVYETASKLGVAVNVHTGPGAPFALPSLCAPIVKEYSDVTFVLAHSGAGYFSGEALVVAQQNKNVYLETSWCSVEDVMGMVASLGTERVMFGSDSLYNIPTGKAIYESINLTADQLGDVFCKTAQKAFKLK